MLLLFNLALWQNVIEIMKESLYDKYVDEYGFVDFARSGGMSRQKAAKKLLSALYQESESERKDCFSRTVSDRVIMSLRLFFSLVSGSAKFGRKLLLLHKNNVQGKDCLTCTWLS